MKYVCVLCVGKRCILDTTLEVNSLEEIDCPFGFIGVFIPLDIKEVRKELERGW